jgi:hypothetical protein
VTLAGLVNQAYPSPEWAVFFEVMNTTGFQASRTADAVALGIWPSRGNAIVGFEFKEDRRDWLREKQNPAKAEAVAGHCDLWWVVAGSSTVVKIDELPAPWGLYVANQDRSKLKAVKQAQPFPDRDKTRMKRTFAAAMLRKVSETTVPRVEQVHDGWELKDLRKTVEQQGAIIRGFKEATGIDLADWRGPDKIAAAVNAVLQMDEKREALEHAKRRLEAAADTLREALDQWPAAQTSQAREIAQ